MSRDGLTATIRRWHIYAGMFSALAFVLFGVSGLVSTWKPVAAPATRTTLQIAPTTGATDEALIEQVRQAAAVPLTSPVPGWAIRRDSVGRVASAYYSVNAIVRVTLDPATGTATLDRELQPLGTYLTHMHAVSVIAQVRSGQPLLLLWSLYIEACVFSLLFFSGSSVYLWLATKPRSALAAAAFISGMAVFVAMWVQVRR